MVIFNFVTGYFSLPEELLLRWFYTQECYSNSQDVQDERYQYVGVVLDNTLYFESHVDITSKKVQRRLYLFKKN